MENVDTPLGEKVIFPKKTNSYSDQIARSDHRRLKIIQQLGGKCCRCGNKETVCLTIFAKSRPEFPLDKHHLANVSWERIQTQLSKHVVLCFNCEAEVIDQHKKK